jgi:hypothetical protein
MPPISDKNIIDSLIEGAVFYYEDERLVNTDEPHYFIVTKIVDDNYIIMTCSTSQLENCQRFCDYNNISYSTLVPIKPNLENGFRKLSIINCNDYFPESKESILLKNRKAGVKIKGKITENELTQIRQGIKDSPNIEDEVKDLM